MAFHVCMLYIHGQPLPDAGTSKEGAVRDIQAMKTHSG